MLIRLGYDIQFDIPEPAPMVAMLHVHPSRIPDLRAPDELQISPTAPIELYHDSYGNICSRFLAQAGRLRLYNSTLIEDSGEPDPVNPTARQAPVQDLPSDVLRFLLASRYSEVDQLMITAVNLFGNTEPGWARGYLAGWTVLDMDDTIDASQMCAAAREVCPRACATPARRFPGGEGLPDHHKLLRSGRLKPGQGNFEIKVGFNGAADERIELRVTEGSPPKLRCQKA